MACPKCGTESKPGAQFCGSCGLVGGPAELVEFSELLEMFRSEDLAFALRALGQAAGRDKEARKGTLHLYFQNHEKGRRAGAEEVLNAFENEHLTRVKEGLGITTMSDKADVIRGLLAMVSDVSEADAAPAVPGPDASGARVQASAGDAGSGAPRESIDDVRARQARAAAQMQGEGYQPTQWPMNTKAVPVGMSFQEAVSACFSKYAGYSGRARRAEYWWGCCSRPS